MQPTRWDLILERKPVAMLDHLMEELGQLFAKELDVWPPPVEDFDPLTGQKVAALLADAPQRPDPRVYRQAFALARLDLNRQLDASDDYLRNQRWLEAGLAAKDKPMLLFLSRFLLEQLLALGEATHGRLDRAHLTEVLSLTERHLLGGSP